MEIQKIKISPDMVVINHKESNGTKSNEVETRDSALPAPEFQAAWNKLATLANEIIDCKLAAFKFKITSITFKRDKLDNLGCILHIEVQLETSSRPWHSNTPVKYQLPEGLDESPKYLSGEGIDLLNKLQDLAKKYINGVKAQQELEFESNNEPATEVATIQPPTDEKKKRLPKNRKTCFDCNKPSKMIIENIGYCLEHGQVKMEQNNASHA